MPEFLTRRVFLTAAAGAGALHGLRAGAGNGDTEMYGLIGKMKAMPGQRDALIDIMVEGVAGMPGCLSYVVAQDTEDDDAIWITEVWDSEASHTASLSLPSVKEAITRAGR